MSNTIAIGAADLVKRSAMQITYFHKHPKAKKATTPVQLTGLEHQRAVSVSPLVEMRGIFKRNGVTIFYCFDEIIAGSDGIGLIEHKMFEHRPMDVPVPCGIIGLPETRFGMMPTWFLRSCISQVAFYGALAILNPNREYETASFYRTQEGVVNRVHKFTLDPMAAVKHMLRINNSLVEVILRDPLPLVEFYLGKASLTSSYAQASKWDETWKHREWDWVHRYFTYRSQS